MSKVSADISTASVAARGEAAIAFSPVELQAPFLLRLGSMAIDYMVFLLLPVAGLLYHKLFGESLTSMSDRTLWFLSLLLFLANIIILPMIAGRSIGKFLTGLRVVRIDGSVPGILNIILRQTIGYLITACTLGLGFIWCVFSSKGRSLHDILTGTVVVQGQRRLK
jgi:uncharacterized RDD family membrane protein YckC